MSPLTLSQQDRLLQVAVSPLGPDALVPVTLRGEEAISAPFSFSVDFLSLDAAIQASALLGKPMSIRIAMDGGKERFVHGIVRRFGSRGKVNEFTRYAAELVPKMLMLARGNDCRTFENLTALEIVEQVLRDSGGVSDLQLKATATLKKIPFCVQYRETNLDFIGRMLAEAGLYYYHAHTRDKHVMVISDAHAGSIPAGAVPEVKVYTGTAGERPMADLVTSLTREAGVVSASISFRDHDLLRADSVGTATSNKPGAVGERYDFLGTLGPNDSATLAKLAIEMEEAAHDLVEGTSTCAALETGSRVKVIGGTLGTSGAELLVVRVRHRCEVGTVVGGAGQEARYDNEFVAMPAETRYRPIEPDEVEPMQGMQVARIVGAGNPGDIDVDKDGRVLLQFPWDRGAGKEGKSKHRVHVASAWAGTGWGFVQLPRLGQEVLVDFVEGDPNRPIVVGRVYNSTHTPPYALPANKTQSGWKSRSVGQGAGAEHFNELRFEDKKGSEHVYLHAEKDLQVEVENDETRHVGHDRTSTVDHDETWHVKHDQAGTVDNDQSITVGNDRTVDVGNNETVTVGSDQEVSVGSNQSVAVGGNRSVEAGGDDELTVGGKLTTDVAKKILIKAGDQITLECGQASITLKKDGTITIKGKDLSLDAMGKINAKANMDVTLKGTKISVNGDAQAEFKGAMVKIEGQAMTTLKGAIAQITGDGMLKAGGGISMIG